MKKSWRFSSSLGTRTVLLVIAVVSIAELATFSIVFQNLRAKHLHQSAQYVAGQIRLLQALLSDLNARQRLRLLTKDQFVQHPQIRADGDMLAMEMPTHDFPLHLAGHIEAILGEPVIIRRASMNEQALWARFAAAGTHYWLALPRFEPPELTSELATRLALALLAVLLLAGLFVRSIVRPLKLLGEAVAAAGDGQVVTINPEGPDEIRCLVEQHNHTAERLVQAEGKRREMLAGLTHDLRAPLARLRVRLALLDNNDNVLAGLGRDAEDMERIVDQCLAFMRSETEDVGLVAPLPIADTISDLVARQRELGRPVSMSVDANAAAAQVAISHSSLQRVLDNLIDNALQYGLPPVEIHLSTEPGGWLKLQVSDHGPGIPPEQRAHVLKPFAQGASARATGGNCGLGLAIVRRIALTYQGELVLGDAPGGGLQVTVIWPRC